jgi:hypothetical protein
MSDPRTVLESIAYGSDSDITPADRVRALSELRQLALMDDPHRFDFYDELHGIPDER